MHRAAIESMFGLHLESDDLWFTPCLPSHWQQVELVMDRDGRKLRFILWHGRAADALGAVGVAHASLLQAGEKLVWTDLPDAASFVVAWGDADGT